MRHSRRRITPAIRIHDRVQWQRIVAVRAAPLNNGGLTPAVITSPGETFKLMPGPAGRELFSRTASLPAGAGDCHGAVHPCNPRCSIFVNCASSAVAVSLSIVACRVRNQRRSLRTLPKMVVHLIERLVGLQVCRVLSFPIRKLVSPSIALLRRAMADRRSPACFPMRRSRRMYSLEPVPRVWSVFFTLLPRSSWACQLTIRLLVPSRTSLTSPVCIVAHVHGRNAGFQRLLCHPDR